MITIWTVDTVHIMGAVTGLNLSALVFLVLMVSLDLLFRWLAFGNAESVAIDLAVFAFGYSATEVAAVLVAHDDIDPQPLSAEDKAWIIRAVIGFIILLLLGVIHKILMSELEEVIDALIEERVDAFPDKDPRRRSLVRSKPLVARTTLLSLGGSGITGIVRVGKHKWRRLVADYINSATCGTNDDPPLVKESDLLLGARLRLQALATFAILGTLSVLTVALKF